MKNTLKDNPYLENIIKEIVFDLKYASRHDADLIGMLRYVIKYCEKKIRELEDEIPS